MKVLLVSADDAHSPDAWSGTAFQARVALEAAGHDVVVLTGLPTTRLPWHLLLRATFGAERYPLWMTNSTLRGLARRLRAAEAQHRPDVILSISSQYLVKSKTTTPWVMFSDAPWQTFRERYSPYQRFALAASRYERLEAAAALRASKLVYSSRWAVDEAVRLFGVARSKIEVIPLGANWTPTTDEPLGPPADGSLRLLFIGRDWKRKGGDIAVAVLQHLRAKGVDAALTIVGVPPAQTQGADLLPGVTVIGRTGILRGDTAETMRNLYASSHFLLVPSRAECFGIVYAEAAAFGRPSVALDVDAVSEVVLSGETGLVVPQDTPPEEIAASIAALHRDPARYAALSRRAREHQGALLNWKSFGRDLTTVLEAVDRAGRQGARPGEGNSRRRPRSRQL